MVYSYFVSYTAIQDIGNKRNTANGAIEVSLQKKIKSFDQIVEIAKDIEDYTGLGDVVVDNYILLNKKIGRIKDEKRYCDRG